MKKSSKLSEWHFRRIINKVPPTLIIGRHIRGIYNLSSSQLNEVLKKKEVS